MILALLPVNPRSRYGGEPQKCFRHSAEVRRGPLILPKRAPQICRNPSRRALGAQFQLRAFQTPLQIALVPVPQRSSPHQLSLA